MFTEEELKEKGAKRTVLEYIASEDPTIAIPEAVVEEDIAEGVIVRSDHWRELDTFEGIFESVEVGQKFWNRETDEEAQLTEPNDISAYMHFREIGIPAIDDNMRWKKDSFERYCRGMKLDPDEVMSEFRVFLQRKINARATGTIFAHPNVPERYVLYVDGEGPKGNYIFDG